jgi:ATPase involved in DNA repair
MSSAPSTPPTRSIKRVKTSKDHNHEDDEQCNSDMVSQEERLMFQAELDRLKQKIETFQQENTKLKQENTTFQQEIATRDKKIETFQQENTTLKQEKEDSSLLSILPRRNKLKSSIPNLSLRGLSNYHSCPNKKDATASEIEFTTPDLHELNDRLGLDFGNTGSALRNIIDFDDAGILTYENEYDVQDIVQCALRDAAKICNRIIVKKMSMLALTNAVNRSSSSISSRRSTTTTTMRTDGNTLAPRSIVLNVRRESSIFSNVVDHVVVFDELSGAPVFIVETKKGWSASPSGKDDDNDDNSRSSSTKGISRNSGTPPTAAVLGQVYDQLSEMYAKGHPNPFGAVTCFDETYITCLDNYECRDVLYNLAREEYEDSRLDRIFRNLVVVQQPTTTTTTSYYYYY